MKKLSVKYNNETRSFSVIDNKLYSDLGDYKSSISNPIIARLNMHYKSSKRASDELKKCYVKFLSSLYEAATDYLSAVDIGIFDRDATVHYYYVLVSKSDMTRLQEYIDSKEFESEEDIWTKISYVDRNFDKYLQDYAKKNEKHLDESTKYNKNYFHKLLISGYGDTKDISRHYKEISKSELSDFTNKLRSEKKEFKVYDLASGKKLIIFNFNGIDVNEYDNPSYLRDAIKGISRFKYPYKEFDLR